MTPQRTERLKEAPRSREDSITLQLTFPLSEKKKNRGYGYQGVEGSFMTFLAPRR